MPSLRKNFIYNAILTMSGYIFPLMVYPYVSRILGVSNIGACNFVDSIVEYFTIISMMGMNTIGIREIAKCKGDRKKLDRTFSQLFSLNTISTLIAVVSLILATLLISKFSDYKGLLYIGIGKLFFNYLLINWFFQGLENFKYIAIRTILIKVLFVISVFIFVVTKDDTKTYYFLIFLTFAGNALVNLWYAKKIVTFRFTFHISKSIILSFIMLGVYWLMNSMYSTFNVAYLGFIANDTEVGYYTTANKLLLVIMTFFTTVTSVLVPRISNVLSSNTTNGMMQAKELINKAINALLLFVIPLIILVAYFSKSIISIMAGTGYEGAILPLQIMAPLFFLIGYDQIIVLQTLLPLNKDKIILRNSSLAAAVGITANILLVPKFGSIGSAMVLILAEMVVLTTSQYSVKKYLGLSFPYVNLVKNAIIMSPLSLICYGIKSIIYSEIFAFALCCILCIAYVLIAGVYILKNKDLVSTVSKIF